MILDVCSPQHEETNTPYRQLAIGILLQAVRDLTDRNFTQALDAYLWLAGPGKDLAEFVGVEIKPPLYVITNRSYQRKPRGKNGGKKKSDVC